MDMKRSYIPHRWSHPEGGACHPRAGMAGCPL